MRVFSVVSTVLFLVIWCLLIVSFASPWYHYDGREGYREDGQMLRVYSFYPTKVKIDHLGPIYDGTYSYKEFQDYFSGSTNTRVKFSYKPYIDAGLAFAVLAWIVCTIQLILQVIDAMGKDFVPVVGKFLGIVIFILTFISFLVFLGFKAAINKDCQKMNFMVSCDEANYGFFSKKFFGKTDVSRYGSSAGWNSVLVSSIIAFFASIFNFVFFNKSAAA